jgi:hypothetical protein
MAAIARIRMNVKPNGHHALVIHLSADPVSGVPISTSGNPPPVLTFLDANGNPTGTPWTATKHAELEHHKRLKVTFEVQGPVPSGAFHRRPVHSKIITDLGPGDIQITIPDDNTGAPSADTDPIPVCYIDGNPCNPSD